MRRWFTLMLALSLSACGKDEGGGDDSGSSDGGSSGPDSDGDGWRDDEDCEPEDPYSYPGADDIPYDGIDNDCLGDGDLTDVDGDGYEGDDVGGNDCNDNNPEIYPTGPETCLDGIDNDCDESTSDNDCDADGYDRDVDCEDYDAARNPEATEIWYDGVDQNCDGNDGDQDLDGEDAEEVGGTDCDDLDPQRNAGAEEVCGDMLDNNCDGSANQCFPQGEFGLEDTDRVVYGSSEGQNLGGALLSAGDLDGDGYREILMGAPAQRAVWVVSPPFDGGETVAEVGYSIRGLEGDQIGTALLAPGDLNGDGMGDLVFGAPGAGGAGEAAGAIYVLYWDGDGADLATDAFAIVGGTLDSAGIAIDSYPDSDGDGAAEILVGAPGAGSSLDGEIYMVSHTAKTLEEPLVTFLGTFNNGLSGAALANTGDIDGDGTDDIVIAAPNSNSGDGAAFLYKGPFSGTISMNDYEAYLYPNTEGEDFGAAVAGAGDMDGDGYNDLMIGAPGESTNGEGAGMVFIALGPVTGFLAGADCTYQLAGEAAGDAAGSSIAGVGDLDGDASDEQMVGAPGYDQGDLDDVGRAYLVMGPPGGVSSLADSQALWEGSTADSAAGSAVGGGLDINDDGLKEMFFGVPEDDTEGGGAGAVYFVFGQGI